MKRKNYFQILSAFVLGVILFSCSVNPGSGKIEGKWRWVKSTGGFVGQTLTPESEGYEKHIDINGSEYAEYRDDSLLYKVPYKLEFRRDSTFQYDTIMVINAGISLGTRLRKDTLEIRELCFDCYQHLYVRK